ncbi:CoA pyrophosphatase [Tissierella creatinini]|nr:CoA pyrophosphatase [Tissierella creatinini]TJX63928.1 CoA pyrophosphatase [Soehngenia saccharolytica]
MNIDDLSSKIRNRTPKPLDSIGKYSVLIPLIERNGQWEIIYEMRAKSLKSQPGEVSFPGGRVELGESFEETAVRETMEELLIKRENIKVLGELDYLVSYANFTIHCFLGVISGVNVDKISPNEDEVDHLFTVPVEYFLNKEPKKYELDLMTVANEEFPYSLLPNGKDYNFRRGKHIVFFYKYNDYIIWGFTARMTRHLIDLLKES